MDSTEEKSVNAGSVPANPAENKTAGQAPPAETVKVGPDLVTITEAQVSIDAACEMSEWQVREFGRIPIYFRDKKYFLRQKAAAQKPYKIRYILEPWPAEATGTTQAWLNYDEQTVAERDSAARGEKAGEVAGAFLILVYPLLGFLWSGTKDRLSRIGFVPRSITGISIMVGFGVLLLDGVFAKMLLMGSMRSGSVVVGGIIRTFYGKDYFHLGPLVLSVAWIDVTLFICLVIDVLVRYSQHMREVDSPWGFMEWIKCLVPKPKNPASSKAATPAPAKPAAVAAQASTPAPAAGTPAPSAPVTVPTAGGMPAEASAPVATPLSIAPPPVETKPALIPFNAALLSGPLTAAKPSSKPDDDKTRAA